MRRDAFVGLVGGQSQAVAGSSVQHAKSRRNSRTDRIKQDTVTTTVVRVLPRDGAVLMLRRAQYVGDTRRLIAEGSSFKASLPTGDQWIQGGSKQLSVKPGRMALITWLGDLGWVVRR